MASLEHTNDDHEQDDLYKVRHSLAHVLAQAVLELRPGSSLGFGPPIDDGFYYDFILSEPITEEDFPELTRRMKKIIKRGQRFDREDLSAADALSRIDEMGEPYKREYGAELIEKQGLEGLSFYRNGPFLDMCEGPHVETTKALPRDAFKLRRVAGAYWRGNSDNVMMTRIYAWSFLDKETLDRHVAAYEDAQARDHKKLGRELGLYTIDNDIGKGLPLWLPHGTVIRDELEKLARELEFKGNYQRVVTPHLAKEQLYHTTGHLPYYADDMYPSMEVYESVEEGGEEAADQDVDDATVGDVPGQRVKEAYRLRPMNCPHHHKIFDAEPRSYRDLPLRLAEYGQVYRFEDSGAVGGLVRVRGMCMNDAHIYCTKDQIKDEFKSVMAMYDEAYKVLGLNDYHLRLSKWDPEDPKGKEKFVDAPEEWEECEQMLHEVLTEMDLDFQVGIGEAAFYGPKIDIQFQTVTGREESVSTVQLDFSVPARMNLKYVGPDAFPTWLAPIQVQLLTVSEQFDDYANGIVERLRGHMVRAELAPSNDTLPKKIRLGTTRKIPNLLIVGEREVEEGTVTLRRYGHKEQATMSVEAFEAAVLLTINQRRLEFALS
jgi:threonyl-tRNA synthetase